MASPLTSRVTRAVVATVLGGVLAACGTDATNTDDQNTPSTNVSTNNATDSAVSAGQLAMVCDSPVVVQTDWYPQTEHGGIYELLGDDYVVDAERGATTGSLVFRGADTGVDLEVRAGGPFIESPVVTEMFLDDTITLGYVGSDVALSRYAEAPTLAVFNALTINPQVILWDESKHPGVSTIAEVAADVRAISVFGDRPYMRYLVAQGVVPADKVDTNYKGVLMLATDDIAHQGFATSEPFRYANLESGAVATAYQLVHDAGWTSYPQNLAINKLRLEPLRPCLAALVPMMQQAQIDFIESPDRTVATILDVVERLDTTWSQSPELAAYAVATMERLGIVGNGTTPIFGDFESPRLDDFIARGVPILREQGLPIPDIVAGDIATNEFLDANITMP
ncbi:MAG: hypothetical protein ACO37V_02525 [Ilumatobacteraceae bacterium]